MRHSHVVRFYGDVVRIHDVNYSERRAMHEKILCSPYKREREQHIQLWHTKQNEMYIGRSEAQKKRKKVHKRWSLTFSVHVLFSRISVKKIFGRKKNFLFYGAHYELCMYVCVFVRFSGRRWPAEGRISSLLFLFSILDYNIILLLS